MGNHQNNRNPGPIGYSVGRRTPRAAQSLVPIQYGDGSITNDMFLHLAFGRIALADGSTVELSTNYDPATNTLELVVPPGGLGWASGQAAVQQGPNLQSFLRWLTGSAGGGGLVTSDGSAAVTDDSLGPQTLASVTVPAGTLEPGQGVRATAWGSFGDTDNAKSLALFANGVQLVSNDVVVSPNGLSWRASCTMLGIGVSEQSLVASAQVGSVPQSVFTSQPSFDSGLDLQLAVVAQNSVTVTGEVICLGMTLELL